MISKKFNKTSVNPNKREINDNRLPRDWFWSRPESRTIIFNTLLGQMLKYKTCFLSHTAIGYFSTSSKKQDGFSCRTSLKVCQEIERVNFMDVGRCWYCPNKYTLNLTLAQLKFLAPDFAAVRHYLFLLQFSNCTLYTKVKEVTNVTTRKEKDSIQKERVGDWGVPPDDNLPYTLPLDYEILTQHQRTSRKVGTCRDVFSQTTKERGEQLAWLFDKALNAPGGTNSNAPGGTSFLK